MKNGLYEKPLLKEMELDKKINKEPIEEVELPKVLSKDYELLLRKKLESLPKEEVLSFYQNLSHVLDEEVTLSDLLLSIHEDDTLLKQLNDNRPLTSIAFSSLFTGKKGEPSMYSELKREIRTSDRIDLLISFVKFSGWS